MDHISGKNLFILPKEIYIRPFLNVHENIIRVDLANASCPMPHRRKDRPQHRNRTLEPPQRQQKQL